MAIDVTTTASSLLDPPLWFYRKLKCSLAEKNIQIREKIIYTTKVSGFKVPTLNSGFNISGADMTKSGSFYSGFVHLCVNG